MPYTPIDDTNADWPTYGQQRGRFAGAADAVSRSQPTTLEAPVFQLDKTAFIIEGTMALDDKHV